MRGLPAGRSADRGISRLTVGCVKGDELQGTQVVRVGLHLTLKGSQI